ANRCRKNIAARLAKMQSADDESDGGDQYVLVKGWAFRVSDSCPAASVVSSKIGAAVYVWDDGDRWMSDQLCTEAARCDPNIKKAPEVAPEAPAAAASAKEGAAAKSAAASPQTAKEGAAASPMAAKEGAAAKGAWGAKGAAAKGAEGAAAKGAEGAAASPQAAKEGAAVSPHAAKEGAAPVDAGKGRGRGRGRGRGKKAQHADGDGGGLNVGGEGTGKGKSRGKGKCKAAGKGGEGWHLQAEAAADSSPAPAAGDGNEGDADTMNEEHGDGWCGSKMAAVLREIKEARELCGKHGQWKVGISPRPKINGWECFVRNNDGQTWTKTSNAKIKVAATLKGTVLYANQWMVERAQAEGAARAELLAAVGGDDGSGEVAAVNISDDDAHREAAKG
ncbi:unnamed protein product, partial [Prorocentrum cordatum]